MSLTYEPKNTYGLSESKINQLKHMANKMNQIPFLEVDRKSLPKIKYPKRNDKAYMTYDVKKIYYVNRTLGIAIETTDGQKLYVPDMWGLKDSFIEIGRLLNLGAFKEDDSESDEDQHVLTFLLWSDELNSYAVGSPQLTDARYRAANKYPVMLDYYFRTLKDEAE